MGILAWDQTRPNTGFGFLNTGSPQEVGMAAKKKASKAKKKAPAKKKAAKKKK
jgi:hypothetical protein